MKNIFKVFGIITLVAVIGFSFAACDDGYDGKGRDNGNRTNLFLGTWTGDGLVLTCTDSTWSAESNGESWSGTCTYSRNYNSVVFTQTGGGTYGTATVSANTMTLSAKGTVYKLIIGLTLNSVTANGSDTKTTTQLTLSFNRAIKGLSASDITLSGVSGVSKGTLNGSGPTYTLPITVTAGGTLTVDVSKIGYTIGDSSKTVVIFYYSGGTNGGATDISSFIGTWKNENGAIRTFSATQITGSFTTITETWTWHLDSITPVSNTDNATKKDYPSGFRFSGKLTEVVGSITGVGKVGSNYSETFYLHTNKSSFCSMGGTTFFFKQ